jgi:predicted benzoate:H+ symporter BenE
MLLGTWILGGSVFAIFVAMFLGALWHLPRELPQDRVMTVLGLGLIGALAVAFALCLRNLIRRAKGLSKDDP